MIHTKKPPYDCSWLVPVPRSLTFQFKNRWVSSFSAYRNQISLLSSNLLFPLPFPLQIDIYTSLILKSCATPGPTFRPSRLFSRTSVWPPLESEPHVSAPSSLHTIASILPITLVGIHLRDSEVHQSKTCRVPGGSLAIHPCALVRPETMWFGGPRA